MAVRREKVILDLESNLPEGMLKGAAATQVLRAELERLSGVSVRSSRVSQDIERDINKVSVVATKADKSINQLTGRLRLFADIAATLGPALVPLGGVAIAGVAGLASQMGAAAVAGGVLIGSMQGIGDALSALNDAHLEPTVENLNKVDEALGKLSPAAADFAREAYAMLPALRAIRDAGAEGLFPGLTESLDNLERRIPIVARIFEGVGEALGSIAADSSASLASGRWGDFFRFIEDEAPTAIAELASTVGSLTHGMAELWQAMTPLNRDFSSWLDGVAKGFDEWATGLSQTDGFRDFVSYIRETGPQVSETLGALANALVQMVQAAAPLGGPILQAIEAVADVLAAVANSPAGPVLFSAAAGFAAFSRAMAGYEAIKGTRLVSTLTGISTNADGAAKGLSGLNKAALGLAGLTVAFVALDELNKKLDETLPGLETLQSRLIGVASAPEGFSISLGGEFDSLAASIERVTKPEVTDGVQGLFDAIAPGDNRAKGLREASHEIEALDSALADLVTSGNADVAGQAISKIAEGYGLSASQVDKLMTLLPGYNEALASEANNAALAADETRGTADAMGEAAAKTETFKQALARLNNVLDGRADMRDYEAAIDDFTDAIKRNGNTFDITTEKGRENQGMLDGVVSSTLAVAEGMRGANRQKFLSSAISDLRTMADSFGIPKAEVARLIELLKRADKASVNPKINADTVAAMSAIERVRNALAGIKDKSVTVRVTQTGASTANGGFGPDYATGGYTGKGGKYEPAGIVHRGEVVLPQEVVNADWSFLRSRYGYLPGFADGGVVDDPKKKPRKPRPVGGLFVNDNSAALEEAIVRLTDTLGQQTSAVEHETKVRDMWSAKMADLAQATVAGFSTGLFDKSSNPWAASASGGPLGNVNGDIAGLMQRQQIQQQLVGMGITGNALATILSEGDNAQIAALIASGQAQATAAALDQRSALQASVGSYAGNAAYGADFAAASERATAALAEAQRTNAQLANANATLQEVVTAVQESAAQFADQLSNASAHVVRTRGKK